MGIALGAPSLPGATANRPVEHGRQVELDWLRTLVVLGIVPLHVLMTFALINAHFVQGTVVSPELGAVGSFVNAWGVPAIFLMAGAGARFALEHRSAPGFARERLIHLGIPLVLIALILAPLQAYYILLSNPSLITMSAQLGFTLPTSHPEQLRNIVTFYQLYFTYLATGAHQLSPTTSNFIFGQLWFVPRLLIVSFMCLPVFLFLQRSGRPWVERIAALGARPLVLLVGAGLLPGVLLALLRGGWLDRLSAGWIYTDDWSAFFIDLVMFAYGYLIYSSPRLRAAVRRVAITATAMGILCTIAVVAVMMLNRVPPNDYSLASIAYAFGQAFAAWLPALALLGLAMRFLTKPTPLLRYLAPAAFPVYVLHTPIQAICAYYILQVPLYWIIHLLIIMLVTLALSFAIYEYVLKRTSVTSFLFGIRSVKPQVGLQPEVPAPQHPTELMRT